MTDRTCSIEGCFKNARARGWCLTHYHRWHRYGTLEAPQRRVRPECSVEGCSKPHIAKGLCGMHSMRMKRYGSLEVPKKPEKTCSIASCNRPGPFVRGHCNAHYLRLLRFGDVDAYRPAAGENNGRWLGDDVSYSGLHYRIRAERGPASQHSCADCGRQAADWSYDNTGIDEKVSEEGLLYSTDITQYSPRCKPCHRIFDNQMVATG